jgi:hypothetical protein
MPKSTLAALALLLSSSLATEAGATRPSTRWTTASAPHMGYHGGRLLTDARFSVLFWGSYWTTGKGLDEAKYLTAFVQDMASSPAFYSPMFEYSVSDQTIRPGGFSVAATVASEPPSSIGDNGIDDFIEQQIDKGLVPPPGRQVIYAVFLPPGVQSTQWAGLAGKSCTDYCGYHTAQLTTRGSGLVLRYIVMPHHDASCPGCVYASMYDGTADDRARRSATITMGHEMAESITDPDAMVLSFGWDALAQGGQGEIGDLCEGTEDRIDGYSVQKLWSNQNSMCVTTSPASASGCPAGWHAQGSYCTPDQIPGFGCSSAQPTAFGALAALIWVGLRLRRARRAA